MPRNALVNDFDNAMLTLPRVAPQLNELAAPYLSRFMRAPEESVVQKRAIPQIIQGFRFDQRRNDLETLPKKFSTAELSKRLRALRQAIKENVPGARNLDPETLAAMLLKEGREDFGTDMYDTNDPRSVALFNRYSQQFDPESAMFVAAVRDISRRAERKGIPFASAWMPGSRYETAEEYAQSTERFREAVRNPKNAELVEFIRASLED
jgi:hypothetical protein